MSQHRKQIRSEIRSKKQELAQIKSELLAATGRAERTEQKARKKTAQQELFRLKSELRTVKGQAEDTPDGF